MTGILSRMFESILVPSHSFCACTTFWRGTGLKWKGWHAYRRGLATNLHELGIPDKVIQAILRHEDVKTTQRSYIKTLPSVVTEAMKRLEKRIACAADVQQVSVN
jgi:integrase